MEPLGGDGPDGDGHEPAVDEVDEAATGELTELVTLALTEVVAHRDAEPFLAWMRDEAPEVAPGIFDAVDERRRRHAAAALGRALWNALPADALGLTPRKLETPGRNQPCPCGSGEKLKRCCGRALDPPHVFAPRSVTYFLTRVLPREEMLRFLAAVDAGPRLLADLAFSHLADGDAERAAHLAETYLRDEPARLGEAWEPLLEVLLDAWEALDRFGEELPWIEALADDPRAPLAATANERLVIDLVDEGHLDLARQRFERFVAAGGDATATATLEVMLLLAEDRPEEASRAAAAAADRLVAAGHDEDDEPVPFLRDVAEDPDPPGLGVGAGMRSDWVEQVSLHLDALAHRDVPAYPVADGALTPPAEVAEVEETWLEMVPREGTADDEDAEGPEEGRETPRLWEDEDDVEAWLTLLVEHSVAAFDSLVVLADLAHGFDQVASTNRAPQRVALRFADRGRAIVLASLDAAGASALPASARANRPALRLLATRGRLLVDLDREDEAKAASAELFRLRGE